jgi:hypothetical protein
MDMECEAGVACQRGPGEGETAVLPVFETTSVGWKRANFSTRKLDLAVLMFSLL